MPQSCTVTTGARLHFGPLAWKPERGRDFGGWGVMIDQPGCRVRVSRTRGEETPVLAPPDRAVNAFHRVLESLESPAGPMHLEVFETLPEHRGLGSGTQLALAVGLAATVVGQGEFRSAATLASQLGRGLRSAVGIYGFELGGLIIDAGKRDERDVGALATQLRLPAEWRFVLACPKTAAGAAGESESAAFRALPPFPQELTDRLSRTLLTEILPACRTADFESFATALGLYGRLVGEAFEKMQGGIVHPVSQSLFNELAQRGFSGVAQTSWGPTLAILQPSQVAAEGLLRQLQNMTNELSLDLSIACPKNTGANIDIVRH